MPSGTKNVPGRFGHNLAVILRARFEDEYPGNQTQLGRAIGESQSQVSRLLLGDRVIDVDQLQALCDALGLDVIETVRSALCSGSRLRSDPSTPSAPR